MDSVNEMIKARIKATRFRLNFCTLCSKAPRISPIPGVGS